MTLPPTTPTGARRSQAETVRRDLVAVIVLTVLAYLLAAQFELRELFTELSEPLERYQLDELPFVVGTLAIALAWFAWRRWRHADEELQLRLRTESNLARTLLENRLLSQKYLMVQEEERRNLARELHDEMGQCLNAIKLDAIAIREVVHGVQPEAEESANAIVELSGHVYDVIRGIIQRLRPAALDALGLHDAIDQLVSQWQRRNRNVLYRFDARGSLDGLGEVVNITVYRIVQECLTNVAKHAEASLVQVSVQRTAPGTLQITVRDDGRGMDLDSPRTGLGLIGLRERVEALSGWLAIKAAPGAGVEVVAVVPLATAQGSASSDEAVVETVTVEH